jgi:hypothetical protein
MVHFQIRKSRPLFLAISVPECLFSNIRISQGFVESLMKYLCIEVTENGKILTNFLIMRVLEWGKGRLDDGR